MLYTVLQTSRGFSSSVSKVIVLLSEASALLWTAQVLKSANNLVQLYCIIRELL